MKYRKLVYLVTFIILATFYSPYETKAYGECSEYGLMAQYDELTNTCKCLSGYAFYNDAFGKEVCTSFTDICQKDLGIHGTYNYLEDRCKCSSGYIEVDNSCVDEDTFCHDQLGFFSSYDSYSSSCKCSSGYVPIESFLGKVSCVNGDSQCSKKHGIYASYDSYLEQCECDEGYRFDDDLQCVKKQNNVYFKLKALSTDEKIALIESNYDSSNYLIKYSYGCYAASFKTYLNSEIVINLGTDFSLDKYDKVVLQDDNETCDITSVEKVSNNFILQVNNNDTFIPIINSEICPSHATLGIDNECYCDIGYTANSDYTECILITDTAPIDNATNTSTENIFTDVNDSTPYKNSIYFLKSKNIVSGNPDGTFKPYALVNRAEFLKIAVGGLGTNIEASFDQNCFIDILKGQWFTPYICFGKANKIVNGYTDGKFKPEQNVTYVEALKMLLETYDLGPEEKTDPWHRAYINQADKYFISIQGIASDQKLTRAEVAELLTRVLKIN